MLPETRPISQFWLILKKARRAYLQLCARDVERAIADMERAIPACQQELYWIRRKLYQLDKELQ